MPGGRELPREPRARPAGYEIVVRGRLDPRWSAWLGGATIPAAGGAADAEDTVIIVEAIDQPGLRGALNKLWDLNLALVSVRRLAEGERGGER